MTGLCKFRMTGLCKFRMTKGRVMTAAYLPQMPHKSEAISGADALVRVIPTIIL
jgi:hypothetical protein